MLVPSSLAISYSDAIIMSHLSSISDVSFVCLSQLDESVPLASLEKAVAYFQVCVLASVAR